MSYNRAENKKKQSLNGSVSGPLLLRCLPNWAGQQQAVCYALVPSLPSPTLFNHF